MWPFGIWHLPPWMGRVKTGTSLEKRISVCKFLFTLKKSKSEKSRESENRRTSRLLLASSCARSKPWSPSTYTSCLLFCLHGQDFWREKFTSWNPRPSVARLWEKLVLRTDESSRPTFQVFRFKSEHLHTWSGNNMKSSCPVHEQNQNIYTY